MSETKPNPTKEIVGMRLVTEVTDKIEKLIEHEFALERQRTWQDARDEVKLQLLVNEGKPVRVHIFAFDPDTEEIAFEIHKTLRQLVNDLYGWTEDREDAQAFIDALKNEAARLQRLLTRQIKEHDKEGSSTSP
jgi:outer membrane protein assembly factor BamA